jgi:hypothetical protein
MQTSKTTLVLRSNEFSSFTSYYLHTMWRNIFDVVEYDPTVTYNKHSSIFVINQFGIDDYATMLKEQGYKVVVDNLWEYPVDTDDGYYWLQHRNWFWYNECLWWHSLKLNQYQPQRNITHRGFMQIRKPRPDRDTIVATLKPILDYCIWSYQSNTLPGDIDPNDNHYQRHVNPAWYDNTYATIVVETSMKMPGWVTEKTFKPMAHYHPFLIIGTPGHLAHIQGLGFVTFDNMFDESYDTELNLLKRCQIIINNVNNIDITQPYDAETTARLEHNRNRFYDIDLVRTKLQQDIVEPLLNYANS